MDKEPILILEKKAEPVTHKMIIPKKFIEKWGTNYYMKVYEDEIRIIPVKKKGN